ncbi:MAG: AbrB family transcriptional regulator [Rhizobiaceae bacterium]|nr:AbrB family transcriptional regulator [Rhizobiaceae bacterium]
MSTAVQLSIGLVGSLVAFWLGLPMPFLLGSLVATGAYAMFATRRSGEKIEFPAWLRKGFVAVIGVMIGTTFSSDLLAIVPTLGISLALMVPYVAVTLGVGYLLFRHVGKYDRTTAVFAAMPGGLVEAVAFGEQAGGDIRILSLQHFARIVLVVMAVPLLFYIWSGQAVGSAAGQTFSVTPWSAFDVVMIAVLAPLGMLVGPWLRLPAPYLTGPLLLSALIHATSLTATNNPDWLLYLAQLIVGTGLGANFSGATIKQLLNAFALGFVAVSLMLLVSFGFATGVGQLTPLSFDALFISYAPGGVTEMNLIALSLGVSPVITATHHLFRILLTSLLSGFLARSQKRQ